jgi:hypothetical protein
LFKVYDKLLKENDKVANQLIAENKGDSEWKSPWDRQNCRIIKNWKVPFQSDR